MKATIFASLFVLAAGICVGCARSESKMSKEDLPQLDSANATAPQPTLEGRTAMGIPLYPKATFAPEKSWTETGDAFKRKIVAIMVTDDSPQEVLEYYRGVVGSKPSEKQAKDGVALKGKEQGLDIEMEAKSEEGRTKITLSVSGPPK